MRRRRDEPKLPSLKVRAVRTEVRYLKPGDLYSEKSPEQWENMKTNASVFLCTRKMDEDDTELVYRIHIDFGDDVPILDPNLPPGMSQL